MSDKCRAVVFNGDGTFTIKFFDKPAPPDGGAVLKVEAVGMCSSDVAQLNGHQHSTYPGRSVCVCVRYRDGRGRPVIRKIAGKTVKAAT